jgi:hypothetical protein
MVAAWGHLAAAVPALFLCGEEEGGRRGRVGQKLKKIHSEKIEILNLPRLYKFVQGDFRGILTQWFFSKFF